MNALPASLALMLLVVGTSVQAKDQKVASGPAKTSDLKKGLDAMIASASPSGHANRTDRDQGDDNASDRAIQVVCTKDTPAAQRSAICPRPISP